MSLKLPPVLSFEVRISVPFNTLEVSFVNAENVFLVLLRSYLRVIEVFCQVLNILEDCFIFRVFFDEFLVLETDVGSGLNMFPRAWL